MAGEPRTLLAYLEAQRASVARTGDNSVTAWHLLGVLDDIIERVPATPSTPGLDVERLARAIKARMDIGVHRPSQDSFQPVDALDYADAIAAEYAVLTSTEGEPK